MKLKTNTIVLLLIAALGCAGVLVWIRTQHPQDAAKQQEQAQKVFNFSEDQVVALQVQTPKQMLSFVRSQQRFPHTWQMKKPQAKPADEAAIAFLLNLLATSKSPRTLRVEPQRQSEFGFDQSPGTVEVTLQNQQRHRLVLGGQDPTESFVYAQVDPPAQPQAALAVVLVPTAFLSAINRPLPEWQAQIKPPPGSPKAPTPLPSIDPGPSIPLTPPRVPQ
ncbi:MAG: DUF4340 domain-containing protein [Acaryochloris sp. RU_4_1]|nr:DUF4340 domain-containing protein [Acaryochloris sp. RU_4_1]NJR55866.1 DUF4340 domain-containing protein [Acaryochloris sp. CRU_2_0]